MAISKKLSRDDWIKASFRALATGGPAAIRAEAIARDLKVSKGSFYWHFKDVSDLKASMLVHWKEQATEGVIEAVDAHSTDPREQLAFLVDLAAGIASEPYGGLAVEPAIRDWSRADAAAEHVFKEVNARRIAYLESLFGAVEPDPARAAQSSRVLYAGLIGLEVLAHQKKAVLKDDLHALLAALLPKGE